MHLEDLQTPCLLIDLDRVKHNLSRMRELLDGDMARWRPHVKTTKVPEVLSLLLETAVRRFKCATSREAEVLLDCASEPVDLLVAMSHRGPNLQRIVDLASAFPMHRFSMLSEDPDHAAEVRGSGLGVYLDLDPGYHRTGIPLADRQRIMATVESAGPELRGLHYYDGHLHDGTPSERRETCEQIYGELLQFAADLARDDLEIITSGTPTFPHALTFKPFAAVNHTISPGTVVYWDLRSEHLDIPGFRYAATVQSRVISHPLPDRVTCDAGSKALDAAAGDPCAEVANWDGLQAMRPSEEHLPLRVLSGQPPPLGQLLRLVPTHVCPTVNLADEAVLLEGDRPVRIVSVKARGHETRAVPSGDSSEPIA